MGNERAEELIRKCLAGTATPEEEALLESWYLSAAHDQPEMTGVPDYPGIGDEILQQLRAEQLGAGALQAEQLGAGRLEAGQAQVGQTQADTFQAAQMGAEQNQEEEQSQTKIKSPIRLWPRIVAAAAILVILSVGGFFVFRKKPVQGIVERPPMENDILPAGTRATLTLADGRTIPLDSAGSGTLAQQGDAVVQSVNGQLIYRKNQPATPAAQGVGAQNANTASNTPKTSNPETSNPTTGAQTTGTLATNTLTTRPGEHYSVLLPDGTQVWLNSASSITYPVVFAGNERKVTVTGELYFEIVHDAKQPFRVAVKNQVVEDIGTHLNINAYDDEPAINTTLLEGSIKITNTKGHASAILKPGQQATTGADDPSFQIKNVDPEQVVGWKNGYFYFDRADIQTVMRQLARWYNVQVVYKGAPPKGKFKGKVYRNINASEALKILSYFGAHFQIEGKTITVTS